MDQPDPNSTRRKGLWTALAMTAASIAGVITVTLPATLAYADPVPPAPPTADPAPPQDPGAPPPPVDPNAPPADPNAPPPAPAPPPEPGRVNNQAGGFSYVVPAGWAVGDATRLNYGQALLTKETPAGQTPPTTTGPDGKPVPVAPDTSILLGRLDLKLFAGAEPDNTKAAIRLASDMGEFFMPFPGTRVNQQTVPLDAAGMPGAASYYEVKFTDTTKPDGQIWAGVVGTVQPNTPRGSRNERWFVVWLGTAKNPIDTTAAIALANSIRPWTPPPPPEPDPNAPPPPTPVAGGRVPVGVPVPVETPVPEMAPPP